MSTVTSIDGIKIFYEVLGEGAIALVFVSSWGTVTGMQEWKYQLLLSSKYRLVLPDIDKPIKCIVAGRSLPKENRTHYNKRFDTVSLEGLGHVLF